MWYPFYVASAFFFYLQKFFYVPEVDNNLSFCETREILNMNLQILLLPRVKRLLTSLSFGGFFSRIRWQQCFFPVLQLIYRGYKLPLVFMARQQELLH